MQFFRLSIKQIATRTLFCHFVLFYIFLIAMFVTTKVRAEQDSTPPNIILFVTDDQGWGDLSFNGNPVVQTPNIDSIGKRGVSFDRFYVNPVCSSTRAGLLTGRHYLRTGVFSVTRGGEKMRKEEVTIAEMLKGQGYQTGLFGKWHNGAQYPYDPLGQGFDESFGIVDGHQTLYFDPVLVADGKPVKTKGYITDVITDAAIDFIGRKRAEPFFAYIPFNTPHSPFAVPDKYFNKLKKKGISDLDATIYGMMENIDDNVLRVLQAVKDKGIDKNTIVLFMSDNGPQFPDGNTRYNAGLKGRKGQIDEGGVRSPLLVYWPNKIEGGKKIKEIAQHLDIVPTIMSIVGAELPNDKKIDGMDLSSLLFSDVVDGEWPERSLFLHHFHNVRRGIDQAVQPNPGAVRTQKWLATFQKSGQWQLYDMRTDPFQNNDLSSKFPIVLSGLTKQYMDFYHDVTAKPVERLPIEIGYSQFPLVILPAHEALIHGRGIEYGNDWGWAHDWINLTSETTQAIINWPVNIIEKGQYQLIVKYASQNKRSHLQGSLDIMGSTYSLDLSLPKYTPTVNHGQSRYSAGESPELTWQSYEIGHFLIPEDVGELTIRIDKVGGEESIYIKAVDIVKQ
ncbi:arylsulfatase [Paraglaciecola arctica]|uniref:arylsulfatase n=1 Tax=Paraglaciecola arctica TaxID=1128911 RepID=UPI001C078906|nr:arylsulfatase [Paraglaciecola arctica]MBU3005369.1 arylsulfatase [Paraglaciecola arctica]